MRTLVLAAAIAAALPALQGCFPVIATGAAVTAVSAADRRTTGAQVDDQGIELRAERALTDRIPPIKAAIAVVSYNRRALLIGQVASEDVKQEATRIVQGITNVREVINELEVAGGTGFGTKANDTYITGKVKASLVEANNVPAATIKVKTERGTVYLMGLVTDAEGQRAAQVAAGVSGVIRVVKVFEPLSASDIERLNTAPTPAPASAETAPVSQ
ncbi:MAG TPA: BON domain-containing protein [Burkholderiaceae bacterium]|nr:BON domain-containing protein [Burkholderiaceae bacterium]